MAVDPLPGVAEQDFDLVLMHECEAEVRAAKFKPLLPSTHMQLTIDGAANSSRSAQQLPYCVQSLIAIAPER